MKRRTRRRKAVWTIALKIGEWTGFTIAAVMLLSIIGALVGSVFFGPLTLSFYYWMVLPCVGIGTILYLLFDHKRV